MERLSHITLAVAACVLCHSSRGAADEAAARQDIRDTYTFSPHTLSSEQISEKSKVLDGLWARAKAQKEA